MFGHENQRRGIHDTGLPSTTFTCLGRLIIYKYHVYCSRFIACKCNFTPEYDAIGDFKGDKLPQLGKAVPAWPWGALAWLGLDSATSLATHAGL